MCGAQRFSTIAAVNLWSLPLTHTYIQEAFNTYGLGTGQKQEEETLLLVGERGKGVGERAVCSFALRTQACPSLLRF